MTFVFKHLGFVINIKTYEEPKSQINALGLKAVKLAVTTFTMPYLIKSRGYQKTKYSCDQKTKLVMHFAIEDYEYCQNIYQGSLM